MKELIQNLEQQLRSETAARAKLQGEYEEAVAGSAPEARLAGLEKQMSQADGRIVQLNVRLGAAKKGARNAMRAATVADQRVALAQAVAAIAPCLQATQEEQDAIRCFAQKNKAREEAFTNLRAAVRAAGVPSSRVSTHLHVNDLALFVQFAKEGLSHLTEAKVTGAAGYLSLADSVARNLAVVEAYLKKLSAELGADAKPAQPTAAEVAARAAGKPA